jgi:peptidoglycan/LPS O-acetylase OafA/YrhL
MNPFSNRHPTAAPNPLPTQRPTWLPSYIPELQGLRGIAVLGVVCYHCHPRLVGTWIYGASLWGWAGVNLFFVLSGFLITSILLEAREKPRYFRNFYGRRALRIWPVYVLVLAVCYLNAPWFVGFPIPVAIRSAPWWVYILFLQNLFHLSLPPAIGPTWSLAIEEQYYFLWAPVVRFLRRPWMLAAVLIGALIASPLFRLTHLAWITKTHTVTHIDGIAMGSLLALGLYTLQLSRRVWLGIGLAAIPTGFIAAGTIAGGTAFLDSALTTGFAGAVLAAIASTTGVPDDSGHRVLGSGYPVPSGWAGVGRGASPGWRGARNPLNALLRRGPLAFYGRISYGLYMTHIMVFIYFGWFDARMDHYGVPGNLAVVAFRLVACTALATALWYGFESQILKLKRYF